MDVQAAAAPGLTVRHGVMHTLASASMMQTCTFIRMDAGGLGQIQERPSEYARVEVWHP